MFEYHGWVTVRESSLDDDSESASREIAAELRRRIEQMESRTTALLDLRWMNGELFLHLAGHTNHRASSTAALDLFAEVGALAPGSYGLLHIRDDEDPAHENAVRVLSLVRGRVSESTERLLSPCIPTLESPHQG
ncbi:Imm7 family immunity protein [Streptomyces albipurpureus]|uniref:Immunity 7 family protein n=1 Tax=Streptomyces albipurpureus TaxID=2897419 RepID=A0ABT0URT3_9ACTN|nr:Imm7 family immunity protein [Streptomyces sp. CWNU-1]MCM2391052.1 immunity 7 family protein [Streptomyces sp. CWNU-1]